MKMKIKGKIWRITFIIMSGFALLFVFRLVYGYTSKLNQSDNEYIGSFFEEGMTKRNYASSKYEYKRSAKEIYLKGAPEQANSPSPTAAFDVNQKYEKTAIVTSKSEEFDANKKKVEATIKETNAIVQYEKNSGSKNHREWHLSIGVQPEKFDEFYTFINSVGNIKSAEVTKIDKTNEYKNLNAKKTSLEKIRTSLIEMKNKPGKIDELINLQNRILEIESELQDLGVLLGDFDEENEFCTIKFSLIEGRKAVAIGFLHRLKVAFEWTIQFYLMFLLIVVLATFSGFFILLIIDKLKVLSGIIKKLNE